MKIVKMVFCSIFLTFISVVGICTLDNKNEVAENEKRTLTQFPVLDYGKLMESEYLDNISTAVSDQLEWRADFVESYFKLNKDILGLTYIGKVVIGKEKVLFHGPLNISDWEEYNKKIVAGCEKINEVADVARKNGTKLIVLDIPRKDIALHDYTPDYYPDISKEYLECLEVQKANLSEDISVIDAYTIFQENKRDDGQIYYFYTDHHINPLGNELIYNEIMKVVHQDYPDVEQYMLNKYNVTYKQVNGSFNRKIAWTVTSPDEILNIIPNGWEIAYTRYDNESISDEPILDFDAGGYNSAFMGGNFGETVVSTNREELPSILYSGPSFTNALEALSIPSFDNMYSVDFRYNQTENTLIEYIEQWKPEYVVLISASSISTFNYSNIMTNLGYDKNPDEIE